MILGRAAPAEIETRLDHDHGASGQQWAMRCRAALPDRAAKDAIWQTIIEDTATSARLIAAVAEAFWQPEQGDLAKPLVQRYFTDMPTMATRRPQPQTELIAISAFPRYAVEPQTRTLAAELLGRSDLNPALRRTVVDFDDDLRRALTSRQKTQ